MALDPSTIYVNQIDLPYVGAIRGQLIICLEDAQVYVASGIAGVLIPVSKKDEGTPAFATYALLQAATDGMTAGTVCVVYADPLSSNNTVYVWDGSQLNPVSPSSSGARVFDTLANAALAEGTFTQNMLIGIYADPVPANNTVYIWDSTSLTPILSTAPNTVTYATFADLDAAKAGLRDFTIAAVYQDTTAANNGMYVWTGATLLAITPTPIAAKIFATLADLVAAEGSLSANTLAAVFNDGTAANNTTYVWDGSTLTALNPIGSAISDLQSQIDALQAAIATGVKPYATKAALVADEGNLPDNTVALVYADSTPANNTTYVWTGTALITAYDRLSVALGNAAGFQQTGTGAQIIPFQTKLRAAPIMVTDFHASADGSDYYPALVRAYAVSANLNFPPGSFAVNTPLTYTSDFTITGASPQSSNAGGGTVINAPNGFLKNASTSRKHMVLTNLSIAGNGTNTCLLGACGGFLTQVSIDNYDKGMENSSAFLLHIKECSITRCATIGLSVADFNGSSVRDSYFDAYTPCHISLLDVTPTSGTNNGIPFVLEDNNHNVSGNQFQNISVLRLRGMFEMRDCYFEDFGASADGICFVEIEVGQFDKVGCSIHNNLFNGHGKTKCALNFWGSTNVRCDCFGSVYENKISGMATAPVIYGKLSDGTNNHVAGIQFLNNQLDTGATFVNQDIHYIYRPLAHGNSTTPVTIASSSFATLQIGTNIVTDTAGGMGSTVYTIRNDGLYRLSACVTARSTSGNYPNIEAGLFLGGTQIETANCSITYQTNPTQQMMRLESLVDCTVNQVVQVKARNGETVNNVSFTAEWISEDGQG